MKVVEILLDGSGLEIPGRGTMVALDGGLEGAEMHETERGIDIGLGYIIPYSKCTYWRVDAAETMQVTRPVLTQRQRKEANALAKPNGQPNTRRNGRARHVRELEAEGYVAPVVTQPRADGSGESVPARGKRDRK